MLKWWIASAVLMISVGAQAMPQFEKKYLCSAPDGSTDIVGFEISDDRLVLTGLGDATTSGLPCENRPLQTKTMGEMSITISNTCDDKSISIATIIDNGAGNKLDVSVGVTKTGDGTAQIHIRATGNLNGKVLNNDLVLTCVK